MNNDVRPAIAHLTLASVPQDTPARVLFRGHANWPDSSRGYLRAIQSVPGGWLDSCGNPPAPGDIPCRDYPDEVLTERDDVRPFGVGAHHLLLSARNCLNEYGSQVRIDGRWYRRAGDGPIPGNWPVLDCTGGAAFMRRAGDVNANAGDVVTGLPLIIERATPVSDDFLIANCSDAAHNFAVHPRGIFGPPPPAWQKLSEGFVVGKAAGLSDARLADQLRSIAVAHGAERTTRLLHAVVAQLPNDDLLFVAATGSLGCISRLLAGSFQAKAAFVLENSGSVGWAYAPPDNAPEKVLVGAANRRDAGTVFLAFDAGQFVDTLPHPLLP